jgi:two-component system, OmpR family, alkaline phosphatase synthesis response regulator PhoP
MEKKYKVLIVDDDVDMVELLKYNLEREDFDVQAVMDSQLAVDAAIDFMPDLIVLATMLPQNNGVEICKKLRLLPLFSTTYIFFLTSTLDQYYQEQDIVFEAGGDDFIEKRVGLRALTNKMLTVLKGDFVIRKGISPLTFGDLVINRKSSTVYFKNEPIDFSKPEFDLLFFFAQNPKKVITVDNLISNIWGSDTFLHDLPVTSYIKSVSRKLKDGWISPVGLGEYRFNPH